MKDNKGKVMSKDAFLQKGQYAKEEYEGLIVASDMEQGCYNIAVEIGKDKVLLVDQVKDSEVHERVHSWVPHIQEIQRKYGSDNDLQNYSRS
ncbi:MAG: hypothetical protein ABFD08_13590 [Syntrophomonas sp.]